MEGVGVPVVICSTLLISAMVIMISCNNFYYYSTSDVRVLPSYSIGITSLVLGPIAMFFVAEKWEGMVGERMCIT